MDDLANLLMDLRRQALQQGRPLSQQEMAGAINQGIGEVSRIDAIAKDLALSREVADEQYRLARKQMKQDKKYRPIETAGNLGMAYLFGKQAGLF